MSNNWIRQHGVSLAAVLLSAGMLWTTQIGDEAQTMLKVDNLIVDVKKHSIVLDKVSILEMELLRINQAHEAKSLAYERALRRLETKDENLTEKVVQVEKNQAVETEVLSRLNGTLMKLDTTMDGNLKEINNSIGEVKEQVSRMDERLKGVENKIGGN